MRKHEFILSVLFIAMILGVGVYMTGCGEKVQVEVTTTTMSGTTTPTTTTTTTTTITTTTVSTTTTTLPAEPFLLTSSAFEHLDPIPNQYANTGYGIPDAENISIPLNWVNPPAETVSFALSMVDFGDDPAHPVIHWMVVNIPASVSSLAEGASPSSMPAGSTEIFPYLGPYPPAEDPPHVYSITLWALTATVDPGDITDWVSFQGTVGPLTLGLPSLDGTFDW